MDSSRKTRKRDTSTPDSEPVATSPADLLVDNSNDRVKKKQKTSTILDANAEAVLPAKSELLPVVLGGKHWKGADSVTSIVLFGDSYSKPPNGGSAWIDYAAAKLGRKDVPVTVYNFAVAGATAENDLSAQLSRFFTRFPKKGTPDANTTLDPDTTTYIVYMGINDCGATFSDELEPIIDTLFDAIHDLYVKAGARNFVLVDVPPIHRSPSAEDSSNEVRARVETWNELLQNRLIEFGTSYEQATVFLFSSHQVLANVLDDPEEYDFCEDDGTAEGGEIWQDDLHLRSAAHKILAERLLTSLNL